MCDSTETADLLSSDTVTDEGIWSHAPSTSGELRQYSPKTIGNNNKYCVLIDGATDAQFVITTAKWSAATAADSTPNDKNTSVAVEGSLTILEPKGVVFLDVMVQCCQQLGIDMANAVFVLKTFFVGFAYNEEIGDYVDNITHISPVQFITYDVTGSFNEQGGSYEIAFVAVSGGAARLPQYSRIPGSVSLTAGPTLKSTIDLLQQQLVRMYEPYFECVKAQLISSLTAANKDPQPIVDALRRVTYKLHLDPVYNEYTVSNQPSSIKNSADCKAPATLSSLSNASIEDILHRIMSMSSEVQKEMSEGISQGGSPPIKYEYKIHPTVYMPKNGEVEVTYYIQRYMRPKEMFKSNSFTQWSNYQKGDKETDPILNDQLVQQLIQFEYIYTGKNIDILEFDMKVNTGMAYLQTASMTNTFKGQLDSAPSSVIVPSSADSGIMKRSGTLVSIPVYFGTQLRSQNFKNSNSLIDSAQMAYTLTKHSSIEMADATVRIVGNLNLLSGIGKYSSVAYHRERTENYTLPSYDQPAANEVMGGYGVVPSYAHITVKMPRNNDDIALLTGQTESGESSADYTKDFWFDGFYYIYGVDNVFDGGEFTQTLHLLGIPPEGLIDVAAGAPDKEANFTNRIGDCFQSKIGCGQAPNTNTTVPSATVDNGKSTEEPKRISTLPDANSANAQVKSLSDVKGWDKVTPARKAAITNAAAAAGVNPVTLAQMANLESNFGTNTHNPMSSARGMYQIVPGTWNQVVNNTKSVPGVPRGTPFSEATNDDKNAAVAAAYLAMNQKTVVAASGSNSPNEVSGGDAYLAHFLGPGGAQAVLYSDRLTGGSETVKDAYQRKFGNLKHYTDAKAANPTIISDKMTVGELRAAAATAMVTGNKVAEVVAGKAPKQSAVSLPPLKEAVTNATEKGRTGKSAYAATIDCKANEQKTDTQKSCDQSTPVPSAPPMNTHDPILASGQTKNTSGDPLLNDGIQ